MEYNNMAKIDKVLSSYKNFKGYTGNPPANENEYNELLNDSSRYFQGNPVFEGTAPSWSEIQSIADEIVDAKASALAKLSALGLTEEEVQAIIK
jgi:hypothetical protein